MGASALRVRSTRPAQLPTTAQRRETETGRDRCRPLRSLLLCCVGHRAARSLQCSAFAVVEVEVAVLPSILQSSSSPRRSDFSACTHSLAHFQCSLARSIDRSVALRIDSSSSLPPYHTCSRVPRR